MDVEHVSCMESQGDDCGSTVLIIDPCPLMLQFLEDWSSARQPLSFHTVFSI